MAHVAFLRSRNAHAAITGIDTASGKTHAGRIYRRDRPGACRVITPWVGVLSHLRA